MDKIKSAIIHLFQHHARPESLSNARLVRMVYLADLNIRQKQGSSISDVQWSKVPFGQVESQFVELVKDDPDFLLVPFKNSFGTHKQLIRVKKNPVVKAGLEPIEKQALEEVISQTSNLNWDELLDYTENSSMPISPPRHGHFMGRKGIPA
jgi:hypothetical protein